MKLKVKVGEETRVTQLAQIDWTIQQFKQTLLSQEMEKGCRIRLFYAGRELKDGDVIGKCGLVEGSTVLSMIIHRPPATASSSGGASIAGGGGKMMMGGGIGLGGGKVGGASSGAGGGGGVTNPGPGYQQKKKMLWIICISSVSVCVSVKKKEGGKAEGGGPHPKSIYLSTYVLTPALSLFSSLISGPYARLLVYLSLLSCSPTYLHPSPWFSSQLLCHHHVSP